MKRENGYIVLLGILFIFLPFSTRLASWTQIALILYWVFEGRHKLKLQRINGNRQLIILFALLFLTYTISIIYSENLKEAFYQIEKRVPLIIFPLIIGSIRFSNRQVRLITQIFVGATLMACLNGIYFAITFYVQPTEHFSLIHLPHALSSMSGFHSVYLAIYLALSSIFCVYNFYYAGEKIKKRLFIVIFVFLNIYLLLLGKRMAVIAHWGLLTSFSSFILFRKKEWEKGAILIGAILLLAFGTYTFNPYLRSRIQNFSTFGNGSERVTVLKLTVEEILKAPIFGVGSGDVQDVLVERYKVASLPKHFYGLNPHNEYLYQTLATGLIGLIILLSSIVIPLVGALKSRNYIYSVFLLLFSLLFLTEVVLNRQQGLVVFALFNSLFAFQLKNERIHA